MPLSDYITLTALLAVFVFVTGTVWYLISSEIEYRRFSKGEDDE